MGRTNPTYRDQVRGIEERWSDYRCALRQQNQPHFDRLFEHGRTYADAAGYQNSTGPTDALLVSMNLAQERRIAELEQRLDDGES